MSPSEVLKAAHINRVLVVDDDLTTTIVLDDLDSGGTRPRPSEILADDDHEDTQALDVVLAAKGIAHASAEERLKALTDEVVLAAAPENLRVAYQGAIDRRARARAPLDTILGWLQTDFGIKADCWSGPEQVGQKRYDLLIVDYYLVDEKFEATSKLIADFKTIHEHEDRPLLVVLMSSNVAQLYSEFERIRDECRLSASRFRILAKPANVAGDAVDKEKWSRALVALARQRPLIDRIEQFVKAWETSLHNATEGIVSRLYDLDASAIAMLIDTAKLDKLSFEEYFCDVLSRRIIAEAESNSFPFKEMKQLEIALPSSEIDIALDQGVEVRHGQRAIRCLMSDVLWHRSEWWQPTDALPICPAVVPGDGASEAAAEAVRALRYSWMKRNIRFGTVLRDDKDQLLLNITQACDVQSVTLEKADMVNFLFLRGQKFAIDKVTEGEKSYDSPFFYDDLQSDSFYTLQWQLRRPFAPSLLELVDSLDNYKIVGQLRMDATYAVLAKFVSQASRVALVRLPVLYQCSVGICHQATAGGDWTLAPLDITATAWNRRGEDWRVQFAVDSTNGLLDALDLQADQRAQLQLELADSVKSESKSRSEYHARALGKGSVLLVRMDGRTIFDEAKLKAFLLAQKSATPPFIGKYAVLLRGAPNVDA